MVPLRAAKINDVANLAPELGAAEDAEAARASQKAKGKRQK
jgi:hypothetical protein